MAFVGSKLDYRAQLNGDDVTLSISEDGLAVCGLFDAQLIAFCDVVSFEAREGAAVVEVGDSQGGATGPGAMAGQGDRRLVFTGLGSLLDAFMLELRAAFNAKVLQGFFVEGEAVFEASGEFSYVEPPEAPTQGSAQISVFGDCVCLLPDDERGRRIPLAFACGLQKGDFDLRLSLDGGEEYRFARLGREFDAFAGCIGGRLRQLREDALAAVRALDGSLSPVQLATLAKLMPQGVAAPVGELREVAPSYVAALEAKIAESRAAETYAAFQSICDPARICVGMKTGLAGEQADDVLWFIAPSKERPVAAVELAGAEDTAAATFVYNYEGEEADFVRMLNRAMVAVDFRREVISATDEQLLEAGNSAWLMAAARSAALRGVRASLSGRVIHASSESWARGVREHLGG